MCRSTARASAPQYAYLPDKCCRLMLLRVLPPAPAPAPWSACEVTAAFMTAAEGLAAAAVAAKRGDAATPGRPVSVERSALKCKH